MKKQHELTRIMTIIEMYRIARGFSRERMARTITDEVGSLTTLTLTNLMKGKFKPHPHTVEQVTYWYDRHRPEIAETIWAALPEKTGIMDRMAEAAEELAAG